MHTLLTTAQGSFQLNRFPVRKNDLLRAWDAADEYLLAQFAELNLPVASSLVIVNDGFGALSLALHAYQPTAISDSYLSQQATLQNLQVNGLPEHAVTLLDSLSLPPQAIDCLLIKIPKTLALLEYQLHSLRPLLKADCRIIAAGMAKNIPSSVWDLLARLIGPTTTSLAVKKARLIFAQLDPTLQLPANPYPSCYLLENTELQIVNHANVFSRPSLDIGTRFLLQHLPDDPNYQDLIDLGCGNGLVGLMLAKQMPNAKLSFVDESFMALASARHNYQAVFGQSRPAQFIAADCLSGFEPQSADCIVCNPPFHQQHAVGDHIAWQMFQHAQRVLRSGGELRVIGNRHLNYHQHLKKLFGQFETVASNNKFTIVKALKN